MSSERNPYPPKGMLPEEEFDAILDHTDTVIHRAHRLGVSMSVAYQNGYSYQQSPRDLDVRLLGDQKPTFAASHAKLAVAAFHVDQAAGKPHIPGLVAMLKTSNNEAFAALKEGYAQQINDYAHREAQVEHDILTVREDGTSFSGQTTALDSMRLMVQLLHAAKLHKRRDEVSGALAKNTSRYGVRTVLSSYGDKVTLLNKTGDFYGTDDPEVGENVHHDVGVIFTGKHYANHRLVYSITTSASTKTASRAANHVNRQLGAEYVEAVGGTPLRSLGFKALSLVLK